MEEKAPRIAVLIPCYNEAIAIGTVVDDFRKVLPEARIIVFDNNSTDGTGQVARLHGAEVRVEKQQGKGNVVRSMFARVEADIYLMVDGDATYDADAAPALIDRLLQEGLDLVIAARVTSTPGAYRPGHQFGNWVLTKLTALIFRQRFTDILSGYRIMSRPFVKSFPAHATGFDTEVEIAAHAAELRVGVAELPAAYISRTAGSHSKLSTFRDGWRILRTIVRMTKDNKPMAFFSAGAAISVVVALVLAAPIVETYVSTGLVPRLPTAVLSASLVLLGSILMACGLVLETVTLGRREQKYAAYLAYSASCCSGKSR